MILASSTGSQSAKSSAPGRRGKNITEQKKEFPTAMALVMTRSAKRIAGKYGDLGLATLRSLKQYASIFIILCWIGISAHAAEVSCVGRYETPILEEIAKTLWPSGARPHVVDDDWVDVPDAAPPTSAQPNPIPKFDPTQPYEPVESTATCSTGLLRGSIEKGDYDKIVKLYRGSHPFLGQFKLISSGGNVDEAIKIGRLFRKYMITAWAPAEINGSFFLPGSSTKPLCYDSSECVCASACALIWFGAQDRFGTVGLHRPRINDPTFKALSPAEASAVYRRVLDSVVRYLDEMEVPKQMIESMVATGSAEIRWVDSIKNRLERPPSIAEWKDASCGSFTAQEENTLLELRLHTMNGTGLSQQEALTSNLLSEKEGKKAECEGVLISRQRDRLAPP